jgi:hypothetical protein
MAELGLPPDPYKVLGVDRDATLLEIRSAYRKSVRKCHPDKFNGDENLKAQKQNEFQRVQQAYELLTDEKAITMYLEKVRRAEFDQWYPKWKKTFVEVKASLDNCHEVRQALERSQYEGQSGTLVVHGRINDNETYAIPDTGAECNIIAASFAAKLGLEVREHSSGKQKLLRMANGKFIQTRGIIEADWCFSTSAKNNNETKKGWRIAFYVLGDFVYDLVLGNAFLMTTKTMCHFRERLSRIPRPLNALSVLRVNLLGVPNQRVLGTLEAHGRYSLIRALPDSGSEPNLLSLEYVKRQNWSLTKMGIRDQRLLQFADGSVAKTEGSITANWSFGHRTIGLPSALPEGLEVELHIFRDCPYDMVLGQDVLVEMDAFLKHQDAFEYVESDTEASALNLVIFAKTKQSKADRGSRTNNAAGENDNDAFHDELQ